MGTNYYLFVKSRLDEDYLSGKSYTIGCCDSSSIIKLSNGYLYENTYYPDTKNLEDNFYIKIHIGKKSAGYPFKLYDYENLKNLIFSPDSFVKDEYGEKISKNDIKELLKGAVLEEEIFC